MNLSQAQAHISGLITGDAVLGLLGEPIAYDLLADEKVIASTIRERLAAAGVCFVIDPPFADSASSSPLGGTLLNATVLLMVAESPTVAHTPSGVGLVAAVIEAITRRPADLREPIACAGYDAGTDEHGYVLHVIDFRIQVSVP